MAKPMLFLHIEQGPKSGQCVKCRTTTRSTIGRARANALQISKDLGISQKHLAFFWVESVDKDGADAGWFVTDLQSSNGTLLNNLKIEPNLPFSIKAGDLIKIGAETSIRVDIPSFLPNSCTTTELPKRKANSKPTESHVKSMLALEEPRKTCAHTSSAVQHCEEPAPLPESDLSMHDHSLQEDQGNPILPGSTSVKHHRKGVVKEIGVETGCKASASGIDLSMTVEQWLRHLMEEGPKYLHRVSESMIQDILLESKKFDEFVSSPKQGQ